jgi:hypothetical protein
MELLDRGLQLELLRQLGNVYPREAEPEKLPIGMAQNDPRWLVNMSYLAEQGLVTITESRCLDDVAILDARINARGLDFLQADGGLGAVLNVVTVRLQADTLRALIEERAERGDVPPEEKTRVMRWLQHAGAEGLAEATRRLVGAALDHAPDALRLLGTLPG